MTKLSVNINKIATLRNARGGDVPNVVQFAIDAQNFGAQGITIHPRPDQRHIKYQDAFDLKPVVHTEYNIEGNPMNDFVQLVIQIKPTQVTLVPDAPDAITSNAGWDTIKNRVFLTEMADEFRSHGIRTSIFVDPVEKQIEAPRLLESIELNCTPSLTPNSTEKIDKMPWPHLSLAQNWLTKLGLGVNADMTCHWRTLPFFGPKFRIYWKYQLVMLWCPRVSIMVLKKSLHHTLRNSDK